MKFILERASGHFSDEESIVEINTLEELIKLSVDENEDLILMKWPHPRYYEGEAIQWKLIIHDDYVE